MPKLQPTSIRLSREMKAALKEEAEAKRWPISWVLEDLIRQWMDWKKKQAKK